MSGVSASWSKSRPIGSRMDQSPRLMLSSGPYKERQPRGVGASESDQMSNPSQQLPEDFQEPEIHSELETMRHSAAHVMAHAIQRIWPGAKFGIGPTVENGFYYDVDLPVKLSPEDLPKIEAEM